MRPYQKDIEQLQEELGHHEYMAKNFRQECNAAFAEYFEKRSIEIQNAIAATKKWQEAAISEWSALTRSEREALLLPIYNAAEETVAKISDAGCPEFSRYLDNLFTDFLIDLVEFKE